MPFKSQAQRSWMFANHPAMARRWESVTPKGKLPGHVGGSSESNESMKPGVPRLPKRRKDFGGLVPNQKARHKESHPADEKESMQEKPAERHTRAERGKMSLQYRYESRLQGRDIERAERSR